MESYQGWVLLVATLWAAQAAATGGYKLVNDLRDTVIIGKIGNTAITAAHCRLILDNDWQPLYRGLCTSSALFGILIGVMPHFVKLPPDSFIAVSALAALIQIVRAAWTLRFMPGERRFMEAAITGRDRAV